MPKIDALIKFGQEVQRRRVAMGMTLEDLAATVGLTTRYVGMIENGEHDPSLNTVEALAKGLGVEVGDLFEGSHEFSAEGMEAAYLYEKMRPEVRSAFFKFLKTMRKLRRS